MWSNYLETVEGIRHTLEYKALYKRREKTIERVFANTKATCNAIYPYRGFSQVVNRVSLNSLL